MAGTPPPAGWRGTPAGACGGASRHDPGGGGRGGPGTAKLRETGEGWLFADSFIRHRLRADPGDLWMVEVDGGSMEPLLSSGGHVLIDAGGTAPAPPGIFVIRDGVAPAAKRIEHVPRSEPPRVLLRPLNPEYHGRERDAGEIRVAGRAVRVSRGLVGCMGDGRSRPTARGTNPARGERPPSRGDAMPRALPSHPSPPPCHLNRMRGSRCRTSRDHRRVHPLPRRTRVRGAPARRPRRPGEPARPFRGGRGVVDRSRSTIRARRAAPGCLQRRRRLFFSFSRMVRTYFLTAP